MTSSVTGSRAAEFTYDSRVATGDAPAAPRARLAALDVVRGAVMVLMAIDHVRVYSGQPAGGPTPGIFFTRWVTHFVAPAFLFLAGTAAYLHGLKLGDRGRLSRFLLTRGAWLVLLELTVIRVGWTFNLDFAHYLLAGVIWMIGWCMILMAALVHLPRAALGALAVATILGHNLMDLVPPPAQQALAAGHLGWLWKLLYFGGVVRLGASGPPLVVLFVIVPWVGVMAAGYAFGPVMRMDAERRRRICLRLGGAMVAAFVLLRALDGYGDPRPWRHPPRFAPQRPPAAAAAAAAPSRQPPALGTVQRVQRPPALLRFLGTSKYPASLLFLLMTLGPMMLALPLAERARGPAARALEVFGRVPFFFYLLHIPLIHALACVVSLAREGRVDPWLFTNHPMMNPPPPNGYTWSLPLLYLVFAVAVALLYVPCRWFADLKQRRRDAWLSYL